MAVQAMIMAGGEGVRLHPLTLNMPKPLVPLLGEPVMGYALKLLKSHQITDVGATLWYQPRKIRAAFGKGDAYGVKLRYYEEKSPMGTAGSIGLARDQLRGTFFVLSGDGLTDCDLTRALAFHRERGALATLVLRRVSVPLPYGVVMCDGQGKITRFIEKPTWSRVFSDLVNTGIYILEPEIFQYIPAGEPYDFGKDVFPALLEKGLPMYGFETTGYWCDVGDLRAYLSAQQALLRGETALPHPSRQDASARIHPTARLLGHCLIGKEAVIGPGAVLENAVIGDHCQVGPGAVIKDSCLWSKSAASARAQIEGSVLCEGAVVRQEARLADGCALGRGASVGAGAELGPGVRIWPHLKAPSRAAVHRSIVNGDLSAPLWTGRGADCESAEQACSLCMAFGRVTEKRQLICARGEDSSALHALACGALAAAGCRVLDGGKMTLSALRCLVPSLGMGGGIYAQGQSLTFLDEEGTPLASRFQAAMDACVMRQDGPPAFTRQGEIIRLRGGEEMYLARILPDDAKKPLWSPVVICCDSALLRRMTGEGLERMNVRCVRWAPTGEMALSDQETGFLLDAEGRDVCPFTARCLPTPEQQLMLKLYLCHRQAGRLYDLPGVPRAAAHIAPLVPPDHSDACLQQRRVMADGVAALLMLCQALKHGTLSDLLAGLPETHILSREAPCTPRDKGRILHALCDETRLPHTLAEGVRIQHEGGCATIVPDDHRPLVRITSESADSEFARELCDFYLTRIRGMMEENKTSSDAP